jgi:hypothetical protein
MHYFIHYHQFQGIGFGMVFLSGFVATGKYFRKRRTFAVGISFSGGGVGTFTFIPVARLIIDTFGWRGSVFILAGVTLNGCVFASLLRPFIDDESGLEVVEEIEQTSATNKENGEDGTKSVITEISNTIDEHDKVGNKEKQTISLAVMKTYELNTDNVITSLELSQSQHSSNAQDYGQDISNEVTIGPLRYETDTFKENEESKELNLKTPQGDNSEQDGFRNAFIEKFCPKRLVTNSNFIILMLSIVFIALPEFVPFSMLPDFALNVNCSSAQSTWMLSAVGVGGR